MRCWKIDERHGCSGVRRNRQARFQQDDGTIFAVSLLHGVDSPRPVIRVSGPVNCQVEQGSVEIFDSIVETAHGKEGGLDVVVKTMLHRGGELI